MKLIDYCIKPEYIFRPRQIWQRLTAARGNKVKPNETVLLPWKLPLIVKPRESIGREIWTMGVFDIGVTETLWRLIEPGEMTIDVGANIGYMTSIMAARVGSSGQVLAFEPHPELFQELNAHLVMWRTNCGINHVRAYPWALGDSCGRGFLSVPRNFEENRGLSRLVSGKQSTEECLGIQVERLDAVVAPKRRVGLLKIDVEGQELAVLRGAGVLLSDGGVRDIVFEEQKPYPNATTQFLEGRGYKVFSLRVQLCGPIIKPAREPSPAMRSWDMPSFLATWAPDRAQKLLTPRGWRSLHSRRGVGQSR